MADPKLAGLAEPLRSALVGLMAAVEDEGGRITITSGRRTRAEQEDLRRRHGCAGRVYDRSCKGRPLTAVPGTSKHERGLAVDIEGDKALARRLAPRFGLGFPVASEDWHIEVVDQTQAAAGIGQWVAGVAAGLPATGSTGWAVLTDPHTWLRVAMVVGGLGLVILGGAVVIRDNR